MGKALFGPIDQIGYLVDDLDASVAHWTDRLGVGPWTIFRNSVLEGTYRGTPTTVTMDVALGYQGGIQIELIATPGDTRSPYIDAHGKRFIGIHHVAWIVDDLDSALADAQARGLVLAFSAHTPVVRVVYLESPGEPGVLYELIEGADMRAMMDTGIAATQAWDGTNPTTVIDLADQTTTGTGQ